MSTTPNTVGFVLQAAKPEELDAWLMDRNERMQEFTNNCIELENRTGGKTVYQKGWSRLTVMGFEPEPGAGELPPGWRKLKSNFYADPNPRSAQGRKLASYLETLQVELPPPPGLPSSIRGGLRRNSFHVEQLNGRWYATLGWQPDGLNSVDRERWIDTPLSRYWADREVMDGLTSRMLKED